jgi:bifunctional non-homologous end joining protein LigD
VSIRPAPWGIAKAFARAVAASMAKDVPKRYTANPIKARRRGRVFIDYLRNSREATAIVPYSTRARAGAPVAVPLSWGELSSLKAANQYTVKNLAQRLSKLAGDPWAAMGRSRQALPKLKQKRPAAI